MTRPKQYYYKRLNFNMQEVLNKYIVDAFVLEYSCELNCDIKRYIFPENYTKRQLKLFIRSLENAIIGNSSDHDDFREITDLFVTTELFNVVTKLRQDITSTIIEYYEWEQDDYKDELITIEDVWYHYCSMKIQNKIQKLSINKLRNIFKKYDPDYDDDLWNEFRENEEDGYEEV
jgi:hypothetical protein